MNMSFKSPHGLELKHPPHNVLAPSETALKAKPNRRPIAVKALRWSLAGLALAYLVTHASLGVLLAIGGAGLALLGVATAVCIYEQNNTW